MTTLLKPSREYVDLDFTFLKHPITSNVGIKKSINAVKQSILNLMLLREGDKPFHPEIKSPIYTYLFENASSILEVVLEDEVKKYLGVYEPRVVIYSVKVTFPNPNEIACSIEGEIIAIEEPFTIMVMVDRLR